MTSFKHLREALMLFWDDEVISDNEFLLLYDFFPVEKSPFSL